MGKIMAFRFGVGSLDGPQSSSWKLWVNKEDIYLLQRGVIAAHIKFSFHKSGNCRWARIDPEQNGRQRKIIEWQRDEVPEAGTNACCRLVTLAFPANHLSTARTITDSNIQWLCPASAGQASMIEILLSRDSPDEARQALIPSGRELVYAKSMTGGLFLYVSKADFECGPINQTTPASPPVPGQVFGALRFPDVDETGSGRPVRMGILACEELPPCMWELGGYKVK